MVKCNLTLILSMLFVASINAQGIERETKKGEPFTDPRDNQVYETVRYTTTFPDHTKHTVKWMAQNLNFESVDSYCYKGEEETCNTYGRLYTWSAAMKACPEDWRIPNDEDWYRLSFHFGGNCSSGKALKSESSLWSNEAQRGTNESLFNGLSAGQG